MSGLPLCANLPLTAKLHSAPQQLEAISLLFGKALSAANTSCTPPCLPITSAAASENKDICYFTD